MTYLITYRNGFALCEHITEIKAVLSCNTLISVLPFASLETAYVEGCNRYVRTRLSYQSQQMPALPKLEDMKNFGMFHDPMAIPCAPIYYARYFAGICGDIAGIFSCPDRVVEFLTSYPNGQVIECAGHAEAEFRINQFYWLHIYPMSAYINAKSIPYMSVMKMDTLYELPFSKWMQQYCLIESPFKTLENGTNFHNYLSNIESEEKKTWVK